MNLSLLLFSRTQPGLFIWSEMYKVAHLTDSIITVFTIIFHLNSRTDAFMFRLYTSGITSIKLIVHVLTISSNTYSVVQLGCMERLDFKIFEGISTNFHGRERIAHCTVYQT